MLIQQLLAHMHLVSVLVPAADALSGTKTTTPISRKNYRDVHFILVTGAGATGTSLITVEACTNAAGANPEAVPFKMARQAPGNEAVDTNIAYTDVTAAGFTTTAGANALYVLDVPADNCPEGKPFLRVKGVEQVDSPVVACILAALTSPKYNQQPQLSALS